VVRNICFVLEIDMAMVQLTIDQRQIEVAAGTNLVEAAKVAGIEIPTLCYLKQYEPSTSCQVCMVKDCATGGLIAACGTQATDGMVIESETDELAEVRKTALELLMSEHIGDCRAPCDFACPAHMDIPLMLQQISAQELHDAIVTIKEDIALPAILGRVCPKPCEKGCRRTGADGPVAICDLKRYVADVDLGLDAPYQPPCKPASGKRVAIVGSGPAGLSAAYYLRRAGHACTLVEAESELGGRLRTEGAPELLPREILDAEIGQIIRLGVEQRLATAITTQGALDALCAEFDGVILAMGAIEPAQVEALGLRSARKGIEVDRDSFATSRAGVFAIGNALRRSGMVIRSAADGKEVATLVDQFLRSHQQLGLGYQFASKIGRIKSAEVDQFLLGSSPSRLALPERGANYSALEAAAQSERCFSCTCSSHLNCRLERFCEQYQVDPNRFPRERRPYELVGRESNVQFEPGKCIKCELCIKIAEAAAEPLGLAFIGRGFDVVVGVPFEGTMSEGLSKVAAECVEACPTAALSFGGKRPPVLVQLESGADRLPFVEHEPTAD
jgi:glutamate synthase (NADPH) small chain